MRTVLFGIFFGLALSTLGCGTRTVTEYHTVIVPIPGQINPVTVDGIQLELTPIDDGNKQKFTDLLFTTTIFGQFGQSAETASLGQIGDFRVQITNQTGHIVRIGGAAIKLFDELGNMYDLIDGHNRVSEWSLKEAQRQPGYPLGFSMAAQAKVGSVRFLTPVTELLPHMVWQGYAFFDTRNLNLTAVKGIKFAIFDLVTETDQAGIPIRRSNIEMYFNITQQAMQRQVRSLF